MVRNADWWLGRKFRLGNHEPPVWFTVVGWNPAKGDARVEMVSEVETMRVSMRTTEVESLYDGGQLTPALVGADERVTMKVLRNLFSIALSKT